MFKAFKKGVTGNESAKDAFTDFEAFQATIEPYNFMPFDMICKTSGAIDSLLGQREVGHCSSPASTFAAHFGI